MSPDVVVWILLEVMWKQGFQCKERTREAILGNVVGEYRV